MGVAFYQTPKICHLMSRYIEKSRIAHKGQLQKLLVFDRL